jgi:aspartyl-tRNA(Asn)/glutamyl-tRNA(Gln) amidotransferase subunit A
VGNLTDLGVAQIRDGFRSGEFTAREVAEAFNAAVAKAKALNAFVVETPEHALAAADRADTDRAAGNLKPLSGVPLGIKDLFATQGVQTTAGSAMLGGFEPPTSPPSAASCWRRAPECSASSTWTSLPWARPTRPAPGAG